MKLVAGLGNPGERYAETRHNVGFMVADLLAERGRAQGWSNRFKAELVTAELGAERVVLLKPQTYMNLSGESLQGAAAFYRIHPRDMIVVHDDIDFELGRVAVKTGGGHGGHNGLRSIMAALGGEFTRVRMGVGRPAFDAAHHVLSGFADDEMELVEAMVTRAADAVVYALREGPKKAQNRYNSRPRKPKQQQDAAAAEAGPADASPAKPDAEG